MHERTCKQCGGSLGKYWVRSDKQFCSAACRKAWSRRGDAAKRAYSNIMRDLNTIRVTIKEHEDLRDDLNEKLKRVQAEVTDVLRLTDRETIVHEGQKNDMIAGLQRRRHYRLPDAPKKKWLSPAEARELSKKAGV